MTFLWIGVHLYIESNRLKTTHNKAATVENKTKKTLTKSEESTQREVEILYIFILKIDKKEFCKILKKGKKTLAYTQRKYKSIFSRNKQRVKQTLLQSISIPTWVKIR